MPYFRQWKIQPNKTVSNAEIWHCTKVVLLTHFTCELPLIYAFHPICCYFGMSTYEVPFSPVWLMAAQITLFFFFEDMFHFWAHRALHTKYLYKHIHKVSPASSHLRAYHDMSDVRPTNVLCSCTIPTLLRLAW